MARAAVRAKQQEQARARPAKPARGRRRGSGGGDPNQQLFFTRLRRGQKWLYAAMAAIFALTFVAVGVGSGAGSGLDQLYSGIFGGGSGDAVSQAKAQIKKDPVKGYRALATAYETKGDTAGAIQALQSYVGLKKSDANAWSELGNLELSQGRTYAGQYQQAQQAAQLQSPGQAFQPTGTIGAALGTNPVEQYNAQQVSSQTSQLYQRAVGAYAAALQDYQHVAKLQPRSADAQVQVATAAESAGNYPVALAALKRSLLLAPHSPQRKQIEQAIKQLSPLVPKSQRK